MDTAITGTNTNSQARFHRAPPTGMPSLNRRNGYFESVSREFGATYAKKTADVIEFQKMQPMSGMKYSEAQLLEMKSKFGGQGSGHFDMMNDSLRFSIKNKNGQFLAKYYNNFNVTGQNDQNAKAQNLHSSSTSNKSSQKFVVQNHQAFGNQMEYTDFFDNHFEKLEEQK